MLDGPLLTRGGVNEVDDKGLHGEARTLGGSFPDAGRGAMEHSLRIINREQVSIEGVLSVESFDDEQIILETDLGTLTLRGEDLHIKQLDLESSRLAVDGLISLCAYSAPKPRGGRTAKPRGFLERLLK